MNLKFLKILFILPISWNHIIAQSLEIPATSPKETIRNHTGYSTSYSHNLGQPLWVAYSLNSTKLIRRAERPSRFTPDPTIKPSTVPHEAYTKTGFDRGHLAPAADMAGSVITMKESFYTSNICPQRPGLNRGIWKNLEEQIRTWAQTPRNGRLPELFIVTGPIFTENSPNISRSFNHTLRVPSHFFKAILDTAGTDRAIAFIIPNSKQSTSFFSFAMSIDDLEKVIERDLYPGLPDEVESKIESRWRPEDWP